MRDLEYIQRLKVLNLPSLEFRRVRGYMIEVYEITHEIYDPLTTNLLLTKDLANINTRCHNFKLNKPRVNTKQFQYFFTNRIINLWNSLPTDLVNAKYVNSFKNKIDMFLNVHMFTTVAI